MEDPELISVNCQLQVSIRVITNAPPPGRRTECPCWCGWTPSWSGLTYWQSIQCVQCNDLTLKASFNTWRFHHQLWSYYQVFLHGTAEGSPNNAPTKTGKVCTIAKVPIIKINSIWRGLFFHLWTRQYGLIRQEHNHTGILYPTQNGQTWMQRFYAFFSKFQPSFQRLPTSNCFPLDCGS